MAIIDSVDSKILFLGRIHPIKGLLDLVRAWDLIRRPGWKITLAGPEVPEYGIEVRRLIQKLGLDGDFNFIGTVSGLTKDNCFIDSSIFILPTYSENFGLTIAEALSHGLPVITTTAAPWEDLINYNCGWWVSPGVETLAAALNDALSMTSFQLNEMGERGKQLVRDKYTWKENSRKNIAVSKWVLSSNKESHLEFLKLD